MTDDGMVGEETQSKGPVSHAVFGRQLYGAIVESGHSLSSAAKVLDVPRQRLSEWCNGRVMLGGARLAWVVYTLGLDWGAFALPHSPKVSPVKPARRNVPARDAVHVRPSVQSVQEEKPEESENGSPMPSESLPKPPIVEKAPERPVTASVTEKVFRIQEVATGRTLKTVAAPNSTMAYKRFIRDNPKMLPGSFQVLPV